MTASPATTAFASASTAERGAATTTARQDEVARFSALAARWWDPDGEFSQLHRLNPLRIACIRDRAAERFGRDPRHLRPFAGLDVVDLGCGGGLAAEALARLGARVTAIDASRESIGVAAARAAAAGLPIDYRRAVPEALVDEERQFDLVVALEVVEHVADLDAFLLAAVALTRPGGALAFSTLSRTLPSLLLAKVAAEYVVRWVPPGTHDWRRFVRPSELAEGLRRAGARLVDITGVSYEPLRRQWRLSRDSAINYMAFAVRD